MYSKKLNKIKSAVLSGMIAAASVAGSFSMTAPALSSSAASDDYAKLLQYSLYFYDANMCGDQVGETSAISWRDDCHTGDEVNGGFHDAGDHAMFGLPQGYTASTLGWGYYEFKDAYNSTGQAEHLKAITDYFCDFFKKSTKLSGDTVSNFLYQKGDGNKDHSYWGAPEKQENEQGKRKMFWTSNGASDIAAEYAAALALNYINFGNAEDLKYAEALYKFSTQYNQVATDGPKGFYSSSGCKDEQAWAAGWLYLATNNESYKNDCASKQTQYLGWVHGWDNTGLGAACVYAHITNDWSKVNKYIEQSTAEKTKNGYYFLDKWGSARLNATMQMCALVASKNSSADFSTWCKGQMDYLTGDNPAKTCFITGFASNSAKNTHHRAASGYQGYEGQYAMNENTTQYHPTAGHVLIGALAGGPEDSNGTYSDVMNNYVCNEVAIDYNAGLVGAAAGLYDVYQSGSVVSSIEGVDKVYNGSAPVTPPTPSQTTASTQRTTQSTERTTRSTSRTTQTTPSPSQSSGSYSVSLNQSVDYTALPKDDKMIGWEWADFNIPAGEKPTKVEIKISSNKTIGKWQGAFGSSTEVSPAYWTQTDDMEQKFSGNTGTITWDISSADSKIIQTKYGGELKFGIWWIDCQQFTIDSITVYTNGSSGSVVTQKPVTQRPVTQPTTSPSTPTPSGSGAYEVKLNQSVDYTALPKDDKMIGWEWADFNIPAGEKPKKVEINISSNKTIGKWQGAFGSSTEVSPAYWTQTDDMEQKFSGNKGTITWDISSADSKIIQTKYGGELKFGIWWIDCQQFTIDSIKVYTDGSSSSATQPVNTTRTTRTTTRTTRTTTRTTATRTTAAPVNPSGATLIGDANEDGRVNMADVTAIVQHIGNQDAYGLKSQGIANAELCDNKSGITGMDAVAIQLLLANQINDLPYVE